MREERSKSRDGSWTLHFRYYDDWRDFIASAERLLANHDNGKYDGLTCSSLKENDGDWSGTRNLGDAIQLAYTGWPEGRQKVLDVEGSLSLQKLFPRARKVERLITLAGDEPDIDLYLEGQPEHMATQQVAIRPGYGKVVRISFSRSAIGTVERNQMVLRGIALLSAVKALLTLGLSVELTMVFASEESEYGVNAHYEQYVPILHAGDPLNFDTFAFMCMHPAVMRRLCFAAKDTEPKKLRKQMGFYFNGGYGRSCKPERLPEHDVFLDWSDGLLDSEEEILPFAMGILEKVGIILGKDEVDHGT